MVDWQRIVTQVIIMNKTAGAIFTTIATLIALYATFKLHWAIGIIYIVFNVIGYALNRDAVRSIH